MSSSKEIVTFVKGKSVKPIDSYDNSRLIFLVKSNMKVIPAFKMILKRVKFVKNSNNTIKKNYIIKGMGKNIITTLKIATMLIEELEDELEGKINIYTKQVIVYNKLITTKQDAKEFNDFSDSEEENSNIETTQIKPKTVPGVEIHIPLQSAKL